MNYKITAYNVIDTQIYVQMRSDDTPSVIENLILNDNNIDNALAEMVVELTRMNDVYVPPVEHVAKTEEEMEAIQANITPAKIAAAEDRIDAREEIQ